MSIKQLARPEGDAGINFCAPERSDLYANLGPLEIEALDQIAYPVNVGAGSALLRQHSPARHVYNVVSGALLVERLSTSGRRQVLAFIFPGDFFGIAHHEYFEFSVQALTDATVAAYHRREFGQLTDKLPALKHNMEAISSNILARALDQVFALGQKKAHERVCFLLNQVLQRQPGSTPARLMLPMTRRDIADYLGLTIETVSRAFSRLCEDGVLEINQIYECRILDLAGLQEMASSD